MTIDLSEFKVTKQKVCIAARKASELPPDQNEKLLAAFKSSEITNQGIADWMLDRGMKVSRDAIRLHRVGECCCDR